MQDANKHIYKLNQGRFSGAKNIVPQNKKL